MKKLVKDAVITVLGSIAVMCLFALILFYMVSPGFKTALVPRNSAPAVPPQPHPLVISALDQSLAVEFKAAKLENYSQQLANICREYGLMVSIAGGALLCYLVVFYLLWSPLTTLVVFGKLLAATFMLYFSLGMYTLLEKSHRRTSRAVYLVCIRTILRILFFLGYLVFLIVYPLAQDFARLKGNLLFSPNSFKLRINRIFEASMSLNTRISALIKEIDYKLQ